MIRTLIKSRIDAAEGELGESAEYMRQLIYRFVEAVVENNGADVALREQVVNLYGQDGLVELSLAIGASRFVPVVKRTLGYGTACSEVELRVENRNADVG